MFKSILHSNYFPYISFISPIFLLSYSRSSSSKLIGEGEAKNGMNECTKPESSEVLYKKLGYPGERFDETLYHTCRGSDVVGSHSIRIVSWLPSDEPIGVVIISHGLHEHALRYYQVAHALTSKGIAVYACDHYAHGKSDGTRGLILDYNVLVNDFVEFGELVHGKHPNLPISLLSHSMGTLIGMLSLKSLPFLSSVIFCATPLFSGPSASSPFGLKFLYPITQTSFVFTLTSFLASIDPSGPTAPILLDGITSCELEQEILLNDPLRYAEQIRNITAREVMTMVKICKESLSSWSDFPPFLCLHGEDDSVGLPKGSLFLYEQTTQVPNSKKSYRIYSKLRHEIFHENKEQSEICIHDAVKYFQETMKLL